jgi:hypothetical protein
MLRDVPTQPVAGPNVAIKAITYERGRFAVEGIGAVSARDVLSYGEQGYLTWVADGMRVWVARVATTEGAVESIGVGSAQSDGRPAT